MRDKSVQVVRDVLSETFGHLNRPATAFRVWRSRAGELGSPGWWLHYGAIFYPADSRDQQTLVRPN